MRCSTMSRWGGRHTRQPPPQDGTLRHGIAACAAAHASLRRLLSTTGSEGRCGLARCKCRKAVAHRPHAGMRRRATALCKLPESMAQSRSACAASYEQCHVDERWGMLWQRCSSRRKTRWWRILAADWRICPHSAPWGKQPDASAAARSNDTVHKPPCSPSCSFRAAQMLALVATRVPSGRQAPRRNFTTPLQSYRTASSSARSFQASALKAHGPHCTNIH